ncbi:alpha-glucuronidase [Actinosynnema pretiosum subsp. pretiosum]|uniref:Alpha-glucuronidase n=1 Tax=Actinosynnema pretiosum subsp. pretiosum TaxID=103721 RepID=A0AA45L9Z1_9PSEU|nr:alpha-glucuronidase [Actinosynnema pretiosum subsp. pretiosum]QUF06404.1 alpha-glucuronidase [Actinosynnema pretiosum subsp. pretiosum]
MNGSLGAAELLPDVHPAWLPPTAFRALGSRRVRVVGDGPIADTVRAEALAATTAHGGALVTEDPELDLVLTGPDDDPEAFAITRDAAGTTTVTASGPGLLYGFHHLVRAGESAFQETGEHHPAYPVRMLDHWDNVDVHPVMGQVERGYSGGSLLYADGAVRPDLTRVAAYARLLGSIGVNRVALNNVNVHRTEARLLTDLLPEVVRLAEVFRPHGIRAHLSVTFASPILLGGLTTADPLDPEVRSWWARTTAAVYAAIPDFGGYVVKADSEGQPGPFSYGRDHADGANALAEALEPFGGTVFWRAFVYDHHQDWRDRTTDRARAAHDHFTPLDGEFADNVVLQVKNGPIDFQPREPVSPVIAAMPTTRLAVEFQVTQEYTGQQRHVCYLGPQWSEVLRFPFGDREVHTLAAGVTAVSNVGDDPFWTGHPLAQANLYAFGRLAWDPTADPDELLREWIALTFPDPAAHAPLHELMSGSWRAYEDYTAPLGVGFMVRPGDHYGPDVDGYEYTRWGTYHFADRDGVGVDRTRATGTGFTGQYPQPWREVYEDPGTCPDELLLFFHHVPYGHVLHSGKTVVQHVYDTHFAGVEAVERMVTTWESLRGKVSDDVHERVTGRLAEQLRCAVEWRDQVNTYFLRKSGVPDAHGRTIH